MIHVIQNTHLVYLIYISNVTQRRFGCAIGSMCLTLSSYLREYTWDIRFTMLWGLYEWYYGVMFSNSSVKNSFSYQIWHLQPFIKLSYPYTLWRYTPYIKNLSDVLVNCVWCVVWFSGSTDIWSITNRILGIIPLCKTVFVEWIRWR